MIFAFKPNTRLHQKTSPEHSNALFEEDVMRFCSPYKFMTGDLNRLDDALDFALISLCGTDPVILC